MSFGEFGKKKVGPRLEPERPTPSPKADKSRDSPTSFGRPEGPSSSPIRSGRIGSGIPSKPTFSQVAPPLGRAPKRRRGYPKKRLMLSSISLIVLLSFAYFFISSGSNNQEDVLNIPISEAPEVETTTGTSAEGDLVNWDEIAKSVVYVSGNEVACPWSGSGTVIGDGSYVLTNAHVALRDDHETPCELLIGIIASVDTEPEILYSARAIEFDPDLDLAILRLYDASGEPVVAADVLPIGWAPVDLNLGDSVTVIGFPGTGGRRVTLTNGVYSGLSDDLPPYLKTSAGINHGNSGGAAFTAGGKFIGVPTAMTVLEDLDAGQSLGLIRSTEYVTLLFSRAKDVQSFGSSDVESEAVGQSNSNDPYFDTCKEAKSYGYGPYYEGLDAEYDWYTDRDNDGIVCE